MFTDDVEGACDSYEEFLKKGGSPVYDPVAAKARIEARRAAKAKQVAAYEKLKADAARLPSVEAELGTAEAKRRSAEAKLAEYDRRFSQIRTILGSGS